MNSRLDAEQARVAIEMMRQLRVRDIGPTAAPAILVCLGIDAKAVKAMVEEAVTWTRTKPGEGA